MLDALSLKQCDVQGRLFELSAEKEINSASFVKAFMNKDTAKALDSKYNRMQWAGEEYLLEEILDESGNDIHNKGEVLNKEVLYWMGYVYRYWHYFTGESSAKIYKQAPFTVMKRNYLMFHTTDPELAIEDLKKIYNGKKNQAAVL